MKVGRVLFLIGDKMGAHARFRVYQYLHYLKGVGIKCTVLASNPPKHYLPPGSEKKIVGLITERLCEMLKIISAIVRVLMAPFYDIVFLQRDLLSLNAFPWELWGLNTFPWLEILLRKLSKRLIFDFDDAIFVYKQRKISTIVAMSDFVVVGNKYLKEYAQKYSSHVEIIPTPVDTDKYFPPGKQNRQEKEVTIGWMGSWSNVKEIQILAPSLKKVSEKHNFRFTIISNFLPSLNFLNELDFTFHAWKPEKEVEELQSFDIGVMPLFDNQVNRGKCPLKALLYMAGGIPVIASPVGINREIIIDGVNGFLASDEEDWVEKLSRLIEDKHLREKMGTAGRKTVEEKYSVRANFSKFLHILKKK